MTRLIRFLRLQKPFRPLRFWWWFTGDPLVQKWRWERARLPLNREKAHVNDDTCGLFA